MSRTHGQPNPRPAMARGPRGNVGLRLLVPLCCPFEMVRTFLCPDQSHIETQRRRRLEANEPMDWARRTG